MAEPVPDRPAGDRVTARRGGRRPERPGGRRGALGPISAGPSPTGYSRRVIATQAYRRARRRRLELDRLVLLRRSHRDPGDDESERTVQRDALLAALQQLPPRMRTAVVMRFYGDLSERETAEALGCSTGTVKSQTHKGLARLRAAMGPTWNDDAGRPAGGPR